MSVFDFFLAFNASDHFAPLHPGREGGGLRIWVGILAVAVSLRGVNFGFWSHLGCSGQNAIVFSREGLV